MQDFPARWQPVWLLADKNTGIFMKTLLFTLILSACLLPGMQVHAQLRVTCELNYKKYLLFEPILAKVTIKNVSGRQMVVAENGKDAARFSFDIRNTRNYQMDRRPEVIMIEKPIVLKNQESTELLIYLNSAYTINEIDAYRVRAMVRIGDYAHTSDNAIFDTYEGSILSEFSTQEPPRRYTMRKISRPQKGIFLYLRVDGADGKMNYGVPILDTMVPVFKPHMVMDGRGCIHTLHRKSPQQFVEVVIDANAREVDRTYFRSGFGAVNFMRDEAGQIRVAGVEKISP